MTILPPLSPVANNSPLWLNSTVEMMSAETKTIKFIQYLKTKVP